MRETSPFQGSRDGKVDGFRTVEITKARHQTGLAYPGSITRKLWEKPPNRERPNAVQTRPGKRQDLLQQVREPQAGGAAGRRRPAEHERSVVPRVAACEAAREPRAPEEDIQAPATA